MQRATPCRGQSDAEGNTLQRATPCRGQRHAEGNAGVTLPMSRVMDFATRGLVWAILWIPGLLFSGLGPSLEGVLEACSWDAVLFGRISHVLVRIQDVVTLVRLAMSRAVR